MKKKDAGKKTKAKPRAKGPKPRVRAKLVKPAAKVSKVAKPAEKPAPKPRPKDIRTQLGLRRTISKKRPSFQRQESWRYRRIHPSWRRPKGIDSHMRLNVRGWPKRVKVGYRGPASVRGLHPSGKRDVLVHNVQEVEKLSPAGDSARLARTLGARKREQIVKRAKELGIAILNPQGLRPPKTGA